MYDGLRVSEASVGDWLLCQKRGLSEDGASWENFLAVFTRGVGQIDESEEQELLLFFLVVLRHAAHPLWASEHNLRRSQKKMGSVVAVAWPLR